MLILESLNNFGNLFWTFTDIEWPISSLAFGINTPASLEEDLICPFKLSKNLCKFGSWDFTISFLLNWELFSPTIFLSTKAPDDNFFNTSLISYSLIVPFTILLLTFNFFKVSVIVSLCLLFDVSTPKTFPTSNTLSLPVTLGIFDFKKLGSLFNLVVRSLKNIVLDGVSKVASNIEPTPPWGTLALVKIAATFSLTSPILSEAALKLPLWYWSLNFANSSTNLTLSFLGPSISSCNNFMYCFLVLLATISS